MNKTAIKNFAIWARVQLIEAAKQRAYEYEITEKGENKSNLDAVAGRLLTSDEKQQRQQLIEQIRRKGYAQVMEEAAYTWFNRFIALRFMEVNGFLPSKVRVFTDENGAFKPEIMKEAMTVEIDGLDSAKVLDLLDKQNNEELYKYLLITQCNALNQGLPYMFEKIFNWTELLFPANLLRPDSVLGQMVTEIPEEDWQDAVQIIGWLYQYYNSELKDDTFALLKKNVKISKERIPAATQLFTPDWIVRYMVENSLGRLWFEGHPNFDKSQWKYYLDEAPQEPEVELQLQKIRADYANMKPEDIKVIDPCMGSGHILVYAFDVLLQIYTSCGWSERDAAKSIIENNLYGLDIDDRAGQLAYFAVMMKARKYSRRILNGNVKPNVLAIQDSGFMTDDFIDYVAGKDAHIKADLTLLRSSLKDAKEYGSIINMPKLNFAALYERMDIISREYAEDIFQIAFQTITAEQLLPLVKQAEIMAQKYDVVVTNPPYMGSGGMGNKLTEFVKTEYPNSKSDMSTVFMEKCLSLLEKDGLMAMINIPVWMFLTSYEKLRNQILHTNTIVNMVHPGRGIFGSDFGSTSFVIYKTRISNYIAQYRRLYSRQSEVESVDVREKQFLEGKGTFLKQQEGYLSVPGAPVAYWITDSLQNAFDQWPSIGLQTECAAGVSSGNNDKYLKLWFEVCNKDIAVGIKSQTDFEHSTYKYAHCNKGGSYRKWYGNNEYVALWCKSDEFHRNGSTYKHLLFLPGMTWSAVTIGEFSARFYPEGQIFDHAAPSLFARSNEKLFYYLALTNSAPGASMLKMINPTVNMGADSLRKLPVSKNAVAIDQVAQLVGESITISKADWDSFETSWDFKKHPLI